MNPFLITLVKGAVDRQQGPFLARTIWLDLTKTLPHITTEQVDATLQLLLDRNHIRNLTPTEKTGHQGAGPFRFYVRTTTEAT